MNRSFRASTEAEMRSNRGDSIRREKEEELALFLGMRKREKERNSILIHTSEDFEGPLGSRPVNAALYNISSSTPTRRTGADDFLNSENDKNDYDWLITPPGTPLFPSLEMESQRTVTSPSKTLNTRPTSQTRPELSTRTLFTSRQTTSSPGLNTSTTGLRRSSSSSGPGSRPSTPTSRLTLTSTSKPVSTYASKSMSSKLTPSKSMSIISSKSTPNVSKPASRSSTPTSRPTLASTSKPVSTYVSKSTSSKPTTITSSKSTPTVSKPPSRSSTPTSRPTLPSTKPIIPPRSSTPTKSSTLVSSNPPSRSATPTRRSTTLSTSTNSCTKSSTKSAPPRASSLIVKPISWNPSEMPGFSLSAPPNLKTSLPNKPFPATRGRPGVPAARSFSVEPVSNERIRRQSCSPSRGRLPNGIKNSYGGSVPAVSRIHAKANESVNPGLVGTKMVERVINMRRLIPPKRDDKQSPRSNLSGKSSSPDSSGFGRSFSKKSLDMAVRHMDLRKSIQGNMRRLMTKIPASSMSNVRSGSTHSKTISISNSPLATSSNASSELSVNNNGFCVNINEIEDDINSDKGVRSPASICGR